MLVNELRKRLECVPGDYLVVVNAVKPQRDACEAVQKNWDTFELYESDTVCDDDSETFDIVVVEGFQ